MTMSVESDEPFYVRRRPDPVPFTQFLYNSEKGTVMGRTAVSWGKTTEMLISGFISIPWRNIIRSKKETLNTNTKIF